MAQKGVRKISRASPTHRDENRLLSSPPRKRGATSVRKGLDSRSPASAEDKFRGNDVTFEGAKGGITPAALGYRLPAEWEPHEATWMGWPHNLSDWPGKFAPIPWVHGEIVRKIAPAETVRILVNSKAHEEQARRILRRVGVDLSNAAVLVPTFNDPNDRIALGTLAELFRDRPVVGVHAVDLVWGLGTLHCLTHEQPAVAKAETRN